ncbi:hypothetical protein [Actinoplanes subtropicus]|nr:hypothetical protein [Actinoplanes subtropicus]
MRARHRYFLLTIVAAVVVALTGQGAAAPVTSAVGCPGSTTWDNVLQRCV